MRHLFVSTIALNLMFSPLALAEIYGDGDAVRIITSLQNNRGFCIYTTVITNPATGVVESALCRCVSRVGATVIDAAGQPTIDVSFGNEQACAPPPPTPQQQAAAQARVAQIDQQLNALHFRLQHLWDALDRFGYDNDPDYHARYDAYVHDEGQRGAAAIQQLQAERAAQVSVANFVAPGPAGPAPGPAPAPVGPVIVNPALPQPGGPAVPAPSSSGLLGQPMPDE